MNGPGAPTFVVCHARSGSTLMRYLLDSHPELVCPPELHLGRLIVELKRINSTAYGNRVEYSDATLRERIILSRVRESIDGIMSRICLESKKKAWCEKSVSTLTYLDLISKVYPDARYICLYRNCLDFVHSAIEARRFGEGYGWEEYLQSRGSHPVVDSLVEFWCERTRAILDFETVNAQRCLAVKYEAFVSDAESTCRKVFDFIGVPSGDGHVDRMFQVWHQVGPGDCKILRTRKVETRSVGRGRKIPLQDILPATREQMNGLLKLLSYD